MMALDVGRRTCNGTRELFEQDRKDTRNSRGWRLAAKRCGGGSGFTQFETEPPQPHHTTQCTRVCVDDYHCNSADLASKQRDLSSHGC